MFVVGNQKGKSQQVIGLETLTTRVLVAYLYAAI
jgi:hypothetical protein